MMETLKQIGQGRPSNFRDVRPTVSSAIVRHLQDEGMTLKDIARLLGLSGSFISRVRNKQRSFTLEHLTTLERVIKKPLPIILIEAAELSSVPEDLRPIYAAFRELFIGLQRLRKTE